MLHPMYRSRNQLTELIILLIKLALPFSAHSDFGLLKNIIILLVYLPICYVFSLISKVFINIHKTEIQVMYLED